MGKGKDMVVFLVKALMQNSWSFRYICLLRSIKWSHLTLISGRDQDVKDLLLSFACFKKIVHCISFWRIFIVIFSPGKIHINVVIILLYCVFLSFHRSNKYNYLGQNFHSQGSSYHHSLITKVNPNKTRTTIESIQRGLKACISSVRDELELCSGEIQNQQVRNKVSKSSHVEFFYFDMI